LDKDGVKQDEARIPGIG